MHLPVTLFYMPQTGFLLVGEKGDRVAKNEQTSGGKKKYKKATPEK